MIFPVHQSDDEAATSRCCSALEVAVGYELRDSLDETGLTWVTILSPEVVRCWCACFWRFFCQCGCMALSQCVAWKRRANVLMCLACATTPSAFISDDADDVSLVLRDPRIMCCRGRAVTSPIAGIVCSFLATCCEDPLCPTNVPFTTDFTAMLKREWRAVNAAPTFNVM
jgi:hypothetical protein